MYMLLSITDACKGERIIEERGIYVLTAFLTADIIYIMNTIITTSIAPERNQFDRVWVRALMSLPYTTILTYILM